MSKLRAKKKDAFAKNKHDFEDGIDGVRIALGVLRDYYGGGDKAHEAAGEESTGLEEIESDFSTTTSNSTSVSRRRVDFCRLWASLFRCLPSLPRGERGGVRGGGVGRSTHVCTLSWFLTHSLFRCTVSFSPHSFT